MVCDNSKTNARKKSTEINSAELPFAHVSIFKHMIFMTGAGYRPKDPIAEMFSSPIREFEKAACFAYNLSRMSRIQPLPRFLAILTVLCSLQTPSISSPISPQEAVRNLEKKFASLQSLQADFDQAYFPASMATPLEEKGKFSSERPDRMRWEYFEPEPKVYIYKEGLSLAYFPEDNQLFRYFLSPEEKGSAIFSLLTGRARIEDDYLVEAGDSPPERTDSVPLKLIPKEEGEFSHILLEVDRNTWLIEKAVFLDLGGNRQEFRFHRTRVNHRLGSATFELTVPPGTEIIDDQPPPKK
jgi:outer membrane lipoprotein carrier protein